MKKFKKGDKIVRIGSDFGIIKVGDIFEFKESTLYGLKVKGYPDNLDPSQFKLLNSTQCYEIY